MATPVGNRNRTENLGQDSTPGLKIGFVADSSV
jgi:hypothetical protein